MSGLGDWARFRPIRRPRSPTPLPLRTSPGGADRCPTLEVVPATHELVAAERVIAVSIAGGRDLPQAPASLLLIHGAGSGPSIFEDWYRSFPKMVVRAVDLPSNLDVGWAGMAGYARAVVEAARDLPSPVSLCGWSMGGLVALLASQPLHPHSLVLIEPSPPAEIQGVHPEVELLPGLFNPEEVYGRFPDGQPARPESSLARAERKRGISVPSVPCPTLVVYGREFPEERGRAIARLYGSEELHFPDLDHWGLIMDERVPEAVARYLSRR